MGCIAGCLRAVYHRCSPHLYHRTRVHPEKVPLEGRVDTKSRQKPDPAGNCLKEGLMTDETRTPSPQECLWSFIDQRIPQSPKQPKLTHGSTVYCYVVSTHDDFHTERQVLANEVFPYLKQWCDSVSLQFIPIDFYRGITHEPTTAEFLKLSLLELKRYLQAETMLVVIVLLSETLGWVPSKEQMISANVNTTNYPIGTSLLEMLVAKGAFLSGSPNALFMLREPSFLGKLPQELLLSYRDTAAATTLHQLKSKIKKNFEDQVFSYSASVDQAAILDTRKRSVLNLDRHFKRTVTEFIINRLQTQRASSVQTTLASIQSSYQELELKKLAANEMLGKDSLLHKISAYIDGTSNTPLVVVGEKGSGKSTAMAKCTQLYCERETIGRQRNKASTHRKARPPTNKRTLPSGKPQQTPRMTSARKLPQPAISGEVMEDNIISLDTNSSRTSTEGVSSEDPTWHVFYHFVTIVPRSADLRHILQRLWAVDTFTQPRTSPMNFNVNKLAKEVRHLLSQRSNRKTVIFIDGIDQVLDERPSHVLRWLPVKLSPSVKIILSLNPKSEVRKVLTGHDPSSQEVSVGSLSLSHSRQLITQHLKLSSVPAYTALVDILLGKLGICNPLFAIELVRYLEKKANSNMEIMDEDDELKEIARSLPDDLTKLYSKMIHEVEEGEVGRYAITALCLLHCSHYGLQEYELLELLSALSPSGYSSDSDRGSASTSRNISCAVSTKEIGEISHLQRQKLDSMGREPSSVGLLGVGSRGSPHSQPASRSSISDIEDHLMPQSRLQRQASPTNSWILQDPTTEGESNLNQLSPRLPKTRMAHSNSYPSANDLQAALPPPFSLTPEGSPSTSRALQHLTLPPSRASPSISLLSIEFGNTALTHKQNSASPVLNYATSTEPEIVELDHSDTESKKQAFRSPRPLVGLERVKMLDQSDRVQHITLLSSYQFSQVLHKLMPLLSCNGRPGEARFSLANKAITSAVHQRYFRHPPTSTFPFSFCTSVSFFGADKDHTLLSLLSQASRRGSGSDEKEAQYPRSSVSTPTSLSTANISSLQLERFAQPIEVSKRYDWWHARLAGYFATSSSEDRRFEELPYHLAKMQSYGQLTHCLVHLPLFEQLCTDESVMDLLFYWQCTGGYGNVVSMYQHALEAHEISGASNQEMVRLMHKVAIFLHRAGETETAQQILVDAITLEEDRLEGRLESMASLTLTMTEFLSSLSRQQAEHMEPSLIAEPEYRLLQFAGKSVEFHRSLEGTESQRHLAHLLMILSHHLLHYSTLGGSLALSSTSALEQAREAAQESKDIYLQLRDYGHALDSYLQLASTYFTSAPSRAMVILKEAESLCLTHYGPNNSMMLNIVHQTALLYQNHLNDSINASDTFERWEILSSALYGHDHSVTLSTQERTQSGMKLGATMVRESANTFSAEVIIEHS